jgi:hypothetical protein
MRLSKGVRVEFIIAPECDAVCGACICPEGQTRPVPGSGDLAKRE